MRAKRYRAQRCLASGAGSSNERAGVSGAAVVPKSVAWTQASRRCPRRFQFCRIEHLRIAGSEPQWAPPPTIIQTVKLPADADIPDPTEGDFVLKKQLVDLFECFDRWQNATILRLEFRFGLPCFVEVILVEDASNAHTPDRSHQ
jgi:hypothetical protein